MSPSSIFFCFLTATLFSAQARTISSVNRVWEWNRESKELVFKIKRTERRNRTPKWIHKRLTCARADTSTQAFQPVSVRDHLASRWQWRIVLTFWNLWTGCRVLGFILVTWQTDGQRGDSSGGDKRGGTWERSTVRHDTAQQPVVQLVARTTDHPLRCLSWDITDSQARVRRSGGILWRRWDLSRLAPSFPSSVLPRRSRLTSAAPACLQTGAWSGRWRRRWPMASSTSAPEN